MLRYFLGFFDNLFSFALIFYLDINSSQRREQG